MRLAGAAWLIALLAWLPLEDTNVIPAIAFGLAGVLWLVWRYSPDREPLLLKAAILSGAAGLAVPLAALALMAFKSGLHGHGFAEYTAAQVWSVIQTIFLWPLAGVLAGGLAWRIRRSL